MPEVEVVKRSGEKLSLSYPSFLTQYDKLMVSHNATSIEPNGDEKLTKFSAVVESVKYVFKLGIEQMRDLEDESFQKIGSIATDLVFGSFKKKSVD